MPAGGTVRQATEARRRKMDLIEKQAKLEELHNIGKRVTARHKYTGVTNFVGIIVDETGFVADEDETKYVIQKIQLARNMPSMDGTGFVYRIGYYTFTRKGRMVLGAQYAPILDESEFRRLLRGLRDKAWFAFD